MKAMVLETVGGPLTSQDIPTPTPGTGEALIRVRACGLGLTLVWTKQDRWSGGIRPGKLPRVIGHEIAGEVVDVGDAVSGLAGGDRVVAYYNLLCGRCQMCVSGREDLCDNLEGYIGRQIDGGLAEYVSLPARNLRPLPAGVSDLHAAVAADALATPLHVLRARADVREGETVLVVGGGGGVGVHAVALARALGARPLCVDIGKTKLDLARASGAEWTVDATEGGFDEAVAEYTGGKGADVVVEMVGTSATVGPSFRSLSKTGRMVLVGTYEPDASLGLDVKSMRGERAVLGSRYCTRAEVSEALELVANGIVKPVVTRTCSLEEADEVLEAISRREVAGRAVAVL
jgi:D-arabinose 1-dehydrogenase-like Zn-dependent alcohol dehydrogenase